MIDVHKFVAASPETQSVLAGEYWPEPGELVLGKFVVREQLGAGAMARAYLCSQPAMGNREVVVKLAIGGAYEAATLGRLEHPHIVPVHSLDEDPDSRLSAICMPFRGRSTLTDVLDEIWNPALSRPTSGAAIRNAACKLNSPQDYEPEEANGSDSFVDAAVQLGLQLASALQHAHDRDVRHDDLKPSNVLITPEGEALLMDFNLSNDCMAANRVTGGTLPYMSPEQLRAYQDPRLATEIDPRSDVYALGVVLYELLSGRLPFGGPADQAEAVESMLQRRETPPKPICDINPDVDRAWSDCVMTCLAFSPADRPASAAAWVADAERLVRRTRRGWARSRRWTWAALVLTIFSLAVATRSTLVNRSLNAARGEARTPSEQPSTGPAWLAEVSRLIDRGQLGLATNRLSKELPSQDARIYRRLGFCLFGNKSRSEAQNAWLQALELGDDSTAVLNNLGYIYLLDLDYERAQEFLHRALEQSPESPTVLYNITSLESKLSNLDSQRAHVDNRPYYLPWGGVTAAEKLISIVGHNGLVYYRLAMLYGQIAKVDPAYEPKVFEALANGVRHGSSDSKLASQHPLLGQWSSRPEFQAAMRTEAKSVIPERISRILP